MLLEYQARLLFLTILNPVLTMYYYLLTKIIIIMSKFYRARPISDSFSRF